MARLCKDCRWVELRIVEGEDFSTCTLSDETIINPVTGVQKAKLKQCVNHCSIIRDQNWFNAVTLGLCGRSGRFFEPKEAK